MRLLIFPELKSKKGINTCRDHLRRQVNAGQFPKPVTVGPSGRRIAWIEEEVDAYLEALVAKRSPAPAEPAVEQQRMAAAAAPAAPARRRRPG
jgi:predicted DNA-binding transcriptional regulator AlpA